MVDFSVFDSILDAAFIVDSDGKIIYCNDAAATFCQSSIRRLVGKAQLADVVALTEPDILPFSESSQGRTAPTSFIETEFNLPKASHSGKVQLAVRPIDGQHWAFFFRDVSLEEALHSKYRSELSQKEEYARNLEKLVEARTAELNWVNQTLKAIMNSLGQGFFTFGRDGICGDVFTKACEDILEGVPKARKAVEVLRVPEKEYSQFEKWAESTFKELLPFDDMKGLGPALYPHSQGRHVVLEYYPIRGEGDQINDIVVVGTDKTTEFEAQQALDSERQYAAMIVKYVKSREQFLQFLASVRTSLQSLKAIAGQSMSKSSVLESFRILHTMEGEAGAFSLRDLRQLSRDSQQILEPFKEAHHLGDQAQNDYMASLTEMSRRFDRFLDENSGIIEMPAEGVSRNIELPVEKVKVFRSDLKAANVPSSLVKRFETEFLMVPIESSLKYFDGLVQSVADRLNKKIKPLAIEGGAIKIFPEPYQALLSSLVHAFRNAVDHGLEEPDEREWAGKDPAGEIRVQFQDSGDQFVLTISDDGKGIDPGVIRERVKQKFPDQDFSAASDQEVIQAVCMPGFSSRDAVGEFSGRGVGLDALREEVLRLSGSIHIQSEVGKGTTIQLTFPKLGLDPVLLRSA